MNNSRIVLLFAFCSVLFLYSCRKELSVPVQEIPGVTTQIVQSPAVTPVLTEDFETGVKTTYNKAIVSLASGAWVFSNALLGTAKNDHKTGVQAARIRNMGKLAMNFDVIQGISVLTVDHAIFGKDSISTWELRISTDGGTTWVKNGNTIKTTSPNLQTETFYINKTGNIRVEIIKTGGGINKINIDNIIIYPYTLTNLADNDHLLMGNPSNALADIAYPQNYLMVKTYYDLSYSRSRGTPNWVSWHLQNADVGSVARQDDYRADSTLPPSWYWVNEFSYSGSGFDRGHNCPSGDRTSTLIANSATFLMTNMIPQAPHNNQITWASLEDSCRRLAAAGNELYIIMGSYGTGGTGTNGTVSTVDNGRVNVPSNIWKVVIVIPQGNNDINRVTNNTRVIAINTPNINTTANSWKSYRTSVDAIESVTGYDILSNLPPPLQATLEAKVDNL